MNGVRRTARFVLHNPDNELYYGKKGKGKRRRGKAPASGDSPGARARATETLMKRWRPQG